MEKRQYFIEALQAGAYTRRIWLLANMSVCDLPVYGESKYEVYPYCPARKADDAQLYFHDPQKDLELTPIDGALFGTPIINFKENIVLNPNDLKNVKAITKTTYGNTLVNALVLVYAFGDKVPFRTGRISGGKLDTYIASKVVDYPNSNDFGNTKNIKSSVSSDKATANSIYIHELLKYFEAMSSLSGLTQICAPAISEKAMLVDPNIIKRRDELLLEHKDRLHDPAMIAQILDELVKMDVEYLKGDPAMDFYIKGSTIAIKRSKMMIMYGLEGGLSTTPTLVPRSLNEGWDLEHMPAIADSVRAASYNRGNQTALGGESVKYFYRIFQNTRIEMEDCGSTLGWTWNVSQKNKHKFVGQYMNSPNGIVRISEENVDSLVGKIINVRTPMLCKVGGASFCARCVGDSLAMTPNGLHIAASGVGSTFMLDFMKAMHGKELSTVPLVLHETIS